MQYDDTKTTGIDGPELSTILGRMISAAQLSSTDDETRSDLLDWYNGEPYGDEEEGNSTFISTDIRDAVEAILPDIMDVFTSAESIVEFSAIGPEDEDAAKQETEVCNNIFWQKNNGFLILYNWIKEALIQQNAYVKSRWVEKTRREIEEYEDLTYEEFVGIMQGLGEDFEILHLDGLDAQTGQPVMQGVDPQTGQPQFAPINTKIRSITREKRYVIECVPNEDIYYTPRWHSLNFDGVPVVGHRKEMERGELRQMGFAESSYADATSHLNYEGDAELSRHDTKYHFDGDDDEAGDESTRKVTVYESYIRADIDGDGIAELLQVWSVGDGSTILQWEDGEDAVTEVTGQPFSALSPFLMPHRHVGLSLAELIADVQRVNTVLYRQTLDNTYRNNHARPVFDENEAGEHLFNDLMNPRPGAPVRTGGALVTFDRPPAVIDVTLPLLEKFRDTKEERTGATRTGQGLDSESLNQHSEKTVGAIMDGAMKKRQLIARTFAETGISDLFRRMHRDLRSGPLKKITTRIRNQWVDVDPRTWKHRSDMTVGVGTGSGDRDKKRQGLMLMGQVQRELMAAQAPIVNMQHIFNTTEKVMETYGFDNIEPFMTDPAQLPPPDPSQEKPDPAQIMMQAQIENMRAEAQVSQMKAQAAQMEIQMKAQKQEADLAAEQRRIQQDYEIKMADLAQRRETAQAGTATAAGRLALDRDKAIMEDDRIRDVEELKAETAFQRDIAKSAQLTPPMSYSEVGNG